MSVRSICCTILCFAFAACAPALAQLVVPANASIGVDGGALDLGSTDLQLAGTLTLGSGQVSHVANVMIEAGGALDADSGSLTLFGDWSNAGIFNAGTGTVNFVDGVATSNVSGSSTFHNASFASTSGKTWAFAVGSTQSIDGALSILGTTAQPIQFVSSAAGQVAFIDLLPSGSQNIDHVGVSDVHGSGQPLAPTKTNEGGSGNDLGWFGNSGAVAITYTPVPTLSSWSRWLLALLLLAVTGIFRSRLSRDDITSETLP